MRKRYNLIEGEYYWLHEKGNSVIVLYKKLKDHHKANLWACHHNGVVRPRAGAVFEHIPKAQRESWQQKFIKRFQENLAFTERSMEDVAIILDITETELAWLLNEENVTLELANAIADKLGFYFGDIQ